VADTMAPEADRETTARLRHLRTSPTKVRPVLKLVVGKDVLSARDTLRLCERGVADDVEKVLNSAIANAEHNDNVPEDELFITRAFADEGPTQKRWRPRARGRGTRIRKRTSHITIVVARYADDELEQRRRREAAAGGPARRRPTRRRTPKADPEHEHDHEHEHDDESAEAAPAKKTPSTKAAEKKTAKKSTKKATKKATAKTSGADDAEAKPAKKSTAKKSAATKTTAKKAAKKTTTKKSAAKKPAAADDDKDA
jgi:large subunit ribosomal protein L22